jgi:hypothetical protein
MPCFRESPPPPPSSRGKKLKLGKAWGNFASTSRTNLKNCHSGKKNAVLIHRVLDDDMRVGVARAKTTRLVWVANRDVSMVVKRKSRVRRRRRKILTFRFVVLLVRLGVLWFIRRWFRPGSLFLRTWSSLPWRDDQDASMNARIARLVTVTSVG